MEIKYNIEKSERKALAQKIAEIMGVEVEYLGVPSCAYRIDFFTVSKDAVLSFNDRSDTEIVEIVLDGLAEAGYVGETITFPEGTETETDAEPEQATDEALEETPADTEEDYVEIDVTIISDTEENATDTEENAPDTGETTESEDSADDPETETDGYPLNVMVSIPLANHTVQSLKNLICTIYSRGALLSKATGGTFSAGKPLTDALDEHEFRSVPELVAFIREWEETNPELQGIRFADDELIFDGFGAAPDADHVQAFTDLASAINTMALTQKRVQAKDVDDSNEKYAMRVWLVRIGFGGAEHKTGRKVLMEHLSGHSAFRNDEEKAKWTERQKAKRDAARAEQNEGDNDDAVSE